MAQILSVNIGETRTFSVNGRPVPTGIFKFPADGPISIKRTYVEGDHVADLRVHGGPYKAVYLYPSEHYAFWKGELALSELPFGAFGENLTTEGLTEEEVCIGDEFRFGSAVLKVTQPRMPCFKLALRFERADMVKKFWKSERAGIYFSVVEEGQLQRGDAIEKTRSAAEGVSVAQVVRLFKGTEWDHELWQRALRAPLYGSWKRDIQSRLTETG